MLRLSSFLALLFIATFAQAKERSPQQVLNQPKDKQVTIVEFADFQCPYCKRASQVMEQVIATYGDKVQVVFRNMPLGFHENAFSAAVAGVCAHEQDKFKGMHDYLFAHQDKLGRDTYLAGAASLGMDVNTFSDCLASSPAKAVVDHDLADAETFMVNGTPNFFLTTMSQTVRLNGAYPFEEFKKVLDELLGKQ